MGDLGLLVLPPFPHCVHCSLVFKYVLTSESSLLQPDTIPTFLWHRGKYGLIKTAVRDVYCGYEFDSLNVEERFFLFAFYPSCTCGEKCTCLFGLTLPTVVSICTSLVVEE